MQQQLQEVTSAAAGKLDLAAAQSLELRLEAVERTAERSSEGVRQLTSSTYKRVDEHASAIQRLTLVRCTPARWQTCTQTGTHITSPRSHHSCRPAQQPQRPCTTTQMFLRCPWTITPTPGKVGSVPAPICVPELVATYPCPKLHARLDESPSVCMHAPWHAQMGCSPWALQQHCITKQQPAITGKSPVSEPRVQRPE
jgi:hypothetical protein